MGRTGSSSASGKSLNKPEENVPKIDDSAPQTISVARRTKRSPYVWLSLLLLTIYSFRAIYQQQFENLPIPLSAEQAGKRGFSEAEALKHVKALTSLGPHPVGSDELDVAVEVNPFSDLIFISSYLHFDMLFSLLFRKILIGMSLRAIKGINRY